MEPIPALHLEVILNIPPGGALYFQPHFLRQAGRLLEMAGSYLKNNH